MWIAGLLLLVVGTTLIAVRYLTGLHRHEYVDDFAEIQEMAAAGRAAEDAAHRYDLDGWFRHAKDIIKPPSQALRERREKQGRVLLLAGIGSIGFGVPLLILGIIFVFNSPGRQDSEGPGPTPTASSGSTATPAKVISSSSDRNVGPHDSSKTPALAADKSLDGSSSDPVPTGQLALLRGHVEGVSDLAVLADGERLLSAGKDGTVRMWDLSTMKPTKCYRIPDFTGTPVPLKLALLPDQKRFVTAGGVAADWHSENDVNLAQAPVYIWDLDQETPLRKTDVAAAVSGQFVQVGKTEYEIGSLKPEQRDPRSIGGHRITKTERGKVVSADVTSLVWIPCENRFLMFSPRGACLVDVDTGRGRLLKASPERKQTVPGFFDSPSGNRQSYYVGDNKSSRILPLAVSDDGTHAVIGERILSTADWRLRVDPTWRPADSTKLSGGMQLSPQPLNWASFVFLPRGDQALINRMQCVSWMDFRNVPKSIFEFPIPNRGSYCSLALCSDGRRFLTGEADGNIILWDLRSCARVARFSGHHGRILKLAFSQDGKRAISAGDDKTIRVWDLPAVSDWRAGTVFAHLELSTTEFRDVRLSANDRYAMITHRDSIQCWDLCDEKPVWEYRVPQFGTDHFMATLSPDGHFAALASDTQRTIVIFDMVRNSMVCMVGQTAKERTGDYASDPIDDGVLTCLQFSEDGRRLAAGYPNGMVRVWDVQGNVLANTTIPTDNRAGAHVVSHLAFVSSDDRLLVSTRDAGYRFNSSTNVRLPRVWMLDLKGERAFQPMIECEHSVLHFAASKDSDKLAVLSGDGSVSIHGLGNFEMHQRLNPAWRQESDAGTDREDMGTGGGYFATGAGYDDSSADEKIAFGQVAFAADGATLVTLIDNRVQISATDSGETLDLIALPGAITTPGQPKHAVMLSPAGRLLIATQNGQRADLLSLDRTGAALSFDQNTRFVEPPKLSFNRLTKKAASRVGFSSDGTLAFSATEFEIDIWEVESWRKQTTLRISQGEPNEFTFDRLKDVSFLMNGRGIVVCLSKPNQNTILTEWDLETRKQVREQRLKALAQQDGIPESMSMFISDFDFSPDGAVAISSSNQLHHWRFTALGRDRRPSRRKASTNPRRAQPPAVFRIFSDPGFSTTTEPIYRHVALAPNRTRTAAVRVANTESLEVWDVAKYALIQNFDFPTSVLVKPAFSSDSQHIVVPTKGCAVHMIDLKQKLQQSIEILPNGAQAAVFLPSGRHALLAARDNSLVVWDLVANHMVYRQSEHSKPITQIAVAPDGNHVITAAPDGCNVWDVSSLTGNLPNDKPSKVVTREYREWTSSTGAFTVEAVLVGVTNGVVKLRKKADGSVINVPLEKLSDDDQDYIRQLTDEASTEGEYDPG